MSHTEQSLQPPVVMITGASRGLGHAIALRLAFYKAHLILLSRNAADLERVDDEVRQAGCSSTLLIPHDLRDVNALDSLALPLLDKFGYLDGFVGNAAVLGQLMPVTHIAPEQIDEVFRVNFWANWRLLRVCEPLLRQSKYDIGQAIFMTTSATSGCPAYWGPYAASKAALEAMVRTFVRENRSAKVGAFLIDPGAIRTDMRALAFPGEKPHTVPTPDFVANRVVDYLIGRVTRPDTTLIKF